MQARIAQDYSSEWLEQGRLQALSDTHIEQTILEILSGSLEKNTSDTVYEDFKQEVQDWIFGSSLNKLTGIDTFARRDVMIGCTQFIDNLYMKNTVQYIEGDYQYHNRLKVGISRTIGNLEPTTPLIISMPFPGTGNKHFNMDQLLTECSYKMIPVHIDGAWVTCSRGLDFNFNHNAIRSVGISLSKGLGLGWNRIGIRWTKMENPDSISIMNDFRMNCRALAMIGLHFVRKFPKDYLWNTYGDLNKKVCDDFGLQQTNSIHLALKDGNPVGLTPLIRYLAETK
jgi:hypothetical protein